MKTLVIIGNGFDLNLGIKSSYRHFIESEDCRTLLAKGYNHILKTIMGKYNLHNWVDIEEELKAIAKTGSNLKVKEGIDFFARNIFKQCPEKMRIEKEFRCRMFVKSYRGLPKRI